MSETTQKFLELYKTNRYYHQRDYYEKREKEYRIANEQLITWKGILIGLTTLVSTLAALLKVENFQQVWAILAILLPALSTALAAYDGLFAFDRLAKLFNDAAIRLQRTRSEAPDLEPGVSPEEYSKLVVKFVLDTENILQLEQGQWGQLPNKTEQLDQVTDN